MKIFLCLIFFGITFHARAALRVTLDPGHGGEDEGAVYSGVVESKLVLAITEKLYKRLKHDKQFAVQILRHKEVAIELEDRVKKSNQFHSDLFVSIHANANPNPRANGIEFYIQNQLPVDQETLFLAHKEYDQEDSEQARPQGDVESILYDLKKSHKILKSYQVSSFMRKNWSNSQDKLIRQGPFYVLSHNEIPAVLVEVGYLSHPQERKKLTQNDYQERLAKKIHFALKDYAKNMDKLPTGILKPVHAKTR